MPSRNPTQARLEHQQRSLPRAAWRQGLQPDDNQQRREGSPPSRTSNLVIIVYGVHLLPMTRRQKWSALSIAVCIAVVAVVLLVRWRARRAWQERVTRPGWALSMALHRSDAGVWPGPTEDRPRSLHGVLESLAWRGIERTGNQLSGDSLSGTVFVADDGRLVEYDPLEPAPEWVLLLWYHVTAEEVRSKGSFFRLWGVTSTTGHGEILFYNEELRDVDLRPQAGWLEWWSSESPPAGVVPDPGRVDKWSGMH